MSARQLKATARQMRHLIDETKSAPRGVEGDHLTDEQFVEYSIDPRELGAEILPQVERHLLSCTECSDRMEHLLAVSEAWRGPAGEKRLSEVSQRIRDQFVARGTAVEAAAAAVARLADWLRQLPQCPAALGAVASASLDAGSPIGPEHLSVREDEEGNLHVRISSYDVSLAGTRLVIDPFGRTLTLVPVAPDQVGAAALIPASARRELAPYVMVGWRVESGRESGGQ